jgi:hypothetical protein
MLSKRMSTALAIAAGVVIAVPAQAHPRLVGARPLLNTVETAPRSVELCCNVPLVSRNSSEGYPSQRRRGPCTNKAARHPG